MFRAKQIDRALLVLELVSNRGWPYGEEWARQNGTFFCNAFGWLFKGSILPEFLFMENDVTWWRWGLGWEFVKAFAFPQIVTSRSFFFVKSSKKRNGE